MYLTLASVSWSWFDCSMIGIYERRFNSKAIHIIIQFVLEIAIRVLNIMVVIDNIRNGVIVIIKT